MTTWFGNGSAGSESSWSANRMYANSFVCTATGIVTQARAKVGNSGGGSTPMRIYIYADSSGTPGALLGASDEVSLTGAAVLTTFPFSTPVSVVSGTTYWLAHDGGSPNRLLWYTGSGTCWYRDGFTYPAVPDPMSFTSNFGGFTVGIEAGVDDPTPTAPVANFTYAASALGSPTLNFTDASTGFPEPTYDWDFGDGSAHSTAKNPSHTYATVGTYTVVLTATNASGTDSETKSVVVGLPTFLQRGPEARVAGFSNLTNPPEVVLQSQSDAVGAETGPMAGFTLGPHTVRQDPSAALFLPLSFYLRPEAWLPLQQPPHNDVDPWVGPLTARAFGITVVAPTSLDSKGTFTFGWNLGGMYYLEGGGGATINSTHGVYKFPINFGAKWPMPVQLGNGPREMSQPFLFELKFMGRWQPVYVIFKKTFSGMLWTPSLAFGALYENPTIYEYVISDPAPPPTGEPDPPDPGDEPVPPPEPEFEAEVDAANIVVSFTTNVQDEPEWTEIG